MKIAIVDTYYSDAIKRMPFDSCGAYARELERTLAFEFGTGDFYSYNLKAQGWDVVDIIANHTPLQQLWQLEHNYEPRASAQQIVNAQLEEAKPDVIFLQDLSFFELSQLLDLKKQGYLIAGQCSCRLTHSTLIKEIDYLFTSFPHYLDRFKFIGVPHVIYLPLAFEPRMLTPERQAMTRDLDILFIGGVGESSYWIQGTMMLDAIAQRFGDRFHWYGYGRESIRRNSALWNAYRGEAWGVDQYDLYARAKIVINRHGEIAEGYSNNLRLYEATGMGALVMTEDSKNIDELFPGHSIVAYNSADHLESLIVHFLEQQSFREQIAASGQAHTVARHNYAQRMQIVSDVLTPAIVYQ